MVNKFLDRLKAKSVGTDKLAQKEEFVEFCSNKYDREYKFCDNLGAYPNSPTSILNSFIDQVQLGKFLLNTLLRVIGNVTKILLLLECILRLIKPEFNYD